MGVRRVTISPTVQRVSHLPLSLLSAGLYPDNNTVIKPRPTLNELISLTSSIPNSIMSNTLPSKIRVKIKS